MMKTRLVILIWISCLMMIVTANAQDVPTPPPYRIQVFVDSAFVRAAPSTDAKPVASIFEGNILEAVGRNVDGHWFEVRRPGRATNLGWVSDEFVSKNFTIELLPLTDSTTGVNGSVSIVDSGYGVFVQQESTLRDGPLLEGIRLGVVPYGVTVPVIERNADASWLQINYLGNVGWISGFNVRISAYNLLEIPEGLNLPAPLAANLPIIPPELQFAQAARLRTYLGTQVAMAVNLESFWWSVYRREVMPCDPPAAITDYQYNIEDVRELPELKRIVPRLETGVDSLNASIATLQICGALEGNDVISARNAAINAKVIFQAGVENLDNLEKNIIH
jgi:SH3 domain-containing protein